MENIKSKVFKHLQIAYLINNNKIETFRVNAMRISAYESKDGSWLTKVEYAQMEPEDTGHIFWVNSKELFADKKSLLKSIK